MIRINKDDVTVEGKINLLLSELTLAIHVVISMAVEKMGTPYQEMLENVLLNTQVYTLTDAGMNIEDAMEVVGIDPDNLDLEESIIPDEMKRKKQ